MEKKSNRLNQSEWMVMEKLWERSPQTTTQLYHSLHENPGWSKSTVNTLLARMLEKGSIYYKEGGRARQYYPNIESEEAAAAETESLLDRVYKGSVSLMMSTLVKRKEFTRKEIEALYDVLEELEVEPDD